MHGRHQKKAPKLFLIRGAAVLVLVLALCVSSFVTVMANTVSANVIDGDNSYSFSMSSADLEAILAQAEAQGLAPLGELDTAERVKNTTTVYIRRGIPMTVSEAGRETELVAYKGDTVEKTLLDHNILLKEADEVVPARETEVESPLSVEIKRSCSVNVLADGKSKKLSLTGATVADAIQAAGVKLGSEDSVNFELDEPLFDKMNIRVVRTMKIEITVDGETKQYSVSAQSVQEALQKCGVELSEEDRLNCKPKDKIKDGMQIVVQRVTTEEAVEKEEIPYETAYEDADSLYEGETSVKSAGEKGEKEVKYKLVYVDGKLDGKEVLEEKVIKEPVKEVVLRGTLVQETPAPDYSGGSSSGGVGTFVDYNGNVVSYSGLLTGDCTAYSVPGGTTSLGWDAVYGVIAVDPNIIPYGTRLYVTSPDGSVVYGYGVAGDTGGACMAGDIIADLCYNTIEECSIIGRRVMNVYILS